MLSILCKSRVKSWKNQKRSTKKITKIKPFRNKYNYPSTKDDWKKFQKIIQLLLLMFFILKKEKIYADHVSKYNFHCEEQFILLMIPNGKGWHCFPVNKLSALLRQITSKRNCGFYCLNCLHSSRTEKT